MLDGLLDVMPAGVDAHLKQTLSNLAGLVDRVRAQRVASAAQGEHRAGTDTDTDTDTEIDADVNCRP